MRLSTPANSRAATETDAPKAVLWPAVVEAAVVLAVLGGVLVTFALTRKALGVGDVLLYHKYAIAFWSSGGTFLPNEYPALSVAVMSLSLLPGAGDPTLVFAAWMTAIAGAGYLVMRRFKGRRAAVAYGVYLLAGAIITVAARYDIVPALAVLGALLAAQRRRFGLAYVLLAVGFLLKVFPIALAPLVILEQRRVGLLTGRAWVGATVRDLAPALALTALVLGAAGATGWWHVDSAFRYQSHRPIQVESAPGSVLWLLSFAGFPALSAQGYSSANLVGPLAPYVNSAFWDAGLIAMAALYWLCLRGRLDLGRAFIVATAVVLLASKVLSPQFLIWILPLVAAVEGLDAGWLLVAVLTTAIYPVMYYEFGLLGRLTPPPYPGAFLAVILVRNVLLGALTVRLLHPRLALAWPPRPAGSATVVPARRITLE